MGRATMRQIIDKGEFELVGVYVTSEKKNGLDAGVIAKRSATGVIATTDIDEILAIDADVVLHTSLISVPYDAQNDNVIKLLASGKCVISANGFYRPEIHGEAYAGPLRAAAQKGNVTLAGIGLNPGFAAERMALTLTGMTSDIKEIRCYEVVDASQSASPGLIFGAMGLGTDPAEKDLAVSPVAELYNDFYRETFDYVGEKLGTQLISVSPEHEITLAPSDIKLKVGTIPKGTVGATRWRWRGKFENGLSMVHDILWTSQPELHEDFASDHWRVEIDGEPNVYASFGVTDADPGAPPGRELMSSMAALLLKAAPSVVAAPAGFFDLPAVMLPPVS